MDGICLRHLLPTRHLSEKMFQAYRKRSNCTRRRRRQMRNSPCPIEKAGLFPLLPCPTVGHFFCRAPEMHRCGTRPVRIRGRSTSRSDYIRQPTRGFHLPCCRVPISAAGSLGSPQPPASGAPVSFQQGSPPIPAFAGSPALRKEPAAPPGMAAPSDAGTNAKRGPEAAFKVIGILWIRLKAWLPASPRSRPDSGRHPVRPGTAGASRHRR
nr:hypothetical protein RKHAN_01904 [Rhizobium sp. Khangiran2]